MTQGCIPSCSTVVNINGHSKIVTKKGRQTNDVCPSPLETSLESALCGPFFMSRQEPASHLHDLSQEPLLYDISLYQTHASDRPNGATSKHDQEKHPPAQ